MFDLINPVLILIFFIRVVDIIIESNTVQYTDQLMQSLEKFHKKLPDHTEENLKEIFS